MTCQTCFNATRDKYTPSGYRRCGLMPVWKSYAAHMACQLSPSQWRQKTHKGE